MGPIRGAARARETVSLYGRILSSGRLVDFSTVDPVAARRMFSKRPGAAAAVTPIRIRGTQRAGAQRAEHAECCLRRRDLLASDDALVAFYLNGSRLRSRPPGISIDGGAPRSRAARTCSTYRTRSRWQSHCRRCVARTFPTS
jgi:hypothetical protein